jgi:hypothetical protein
MLLVALAGTASSGAAIGSTRRLRSAAGGRGDRILEQRALLQRGTSTLHCGLEPASDDSRTLDQVIDLGKFALGDGPQPLGNLARSIRRRKQFTDLVEA